jgi:hypothetical protein
MDDMRPINWKNEREFNVEGVNFYCAFDDFSLQTNAERFVLLKARSVLDQYQQVFANACPHRMLEFGIFQGGSPALFSLWFGLEKFVGIDICKPVAAFDAFCARHQVGSRIATHYGVSQTDRGRVEQIIEQEFGASAPDVIIDDASHAYSASLATFETAFPRLQAGGTYVIEDWSWAHWPGSNLYAGKTALSKLVMELIMVCASRPDLISEVRVFPYFAFIRKATTAPVNSPLRLEGLYSSRGLELVGAQDAFLGSVATRWAKRILRRG